MPLESLCLDLYLEGVEWRHFPISCPSTTLDVKEEAAVRESEGRGRKLRLSGASGHSNTWWWVSWVFFGLISAGIGEKKPNVWEYQWEWTKRTQDQAALWKVSAEEHRTFAPRPLYSRQKRYPPLHQPDQKSLRHLCLRSPWWSDETPNPTTGQRRAWRHRSEAPTHSGQGAVKHGTERPRLPLLQQRGQPTQSFRVSWGEWGPDFCPHLPAVRLHPPFLQREGDGESQPKQAASRASKLSQH